MRSSIFATLVICLLVPAVGRAESEKALSPEQILAKIYEKTSATEEEYPGSYSRRDVTTRSFDPDDGTLTSVRKVVADVWTRRGENDVTKILSCEKDGKKEDPDECESKMQGEPLHPVFGKDGKKYHRLEYLGEADFKGTAAYRVKIVPLQETARNFAGEIYFSKDTLRLLGMKGSIADLPFPLKTLEMDFDFTAWEGKAVLANGTSTIAIYVPFLVDTKIVSEFVATKQRLLTEAEIPDS